jgi:hypothetical protein
MSSDPTADQRVARLPGSCLVFLDDPDFSNDDALLRLQQAGITARLQSVGSLSDVEIPSRGMGIRVEAFDGEQYRAVIQTLCSRHPSISVPRDAVSLAFVTWRQAVDSEHPQFFESVLAALLGEQATGLAQPRRVQ